MTFAGMKGNLKQMEEIVREAYIFTNQLNMIESMEVDSSVVLNTQEKQLLREAISSLTNQLRILNNSIPEVFNNIGFYKKLTTDQSTPEVTPVVKEESKLVQVKYNPLDRKESISLVISDQDKKSFLENLSKSNLTINQLKKKFSIQKPVATFGKPNLYAKISNKFYRKFSNDLIAKGYFGKLNKDLRMMNSPFVVGTYASMIFFTMTWVLILSFFLFILLLFCNISIMFPIITRLPADTPFFMRMLKVSWVIFAFPLAAGILMYIYPASEGKTLSKRIEQELPFVTIHMAAIATSGVEPLSIFKIILKSEEYYFTNLELRKLMNLINFHGKDLVTALKETARSSPSPKLKELLEGFATIITSGGNIVDYLNKRAETLLFDYKLERERYTKTAETLMDIYISVVIAAPMILLMLFVIMGSTGLGSGFIGLPASMMNWLIIFGIVILNVGFLFFLKIKQPSV